MSSGPWLVLPIAFVVLLALYTLNPTGRRK